jgi:hypothetical protein
MVENKNADEFICAERRLSIRHSGTKFEYLEASKLELCA